MKSALVTLTGFTSFRGMTHRRVFALPLLAMVLVAASACGGQPSGRFNAGTTPHRDGAAPIAPGGPAAGGPTVTSKPQATPAFTLTPVPIFEDFSIVPTFSNNQTHCSWAAGANGTVVISIQLSLSHQGGIPGHEPTSVNFHLADLTGTRSPEYTSGFTSGFFGITEPVANFDPTMSFDAAVDLSAPDSVPGNDNTRVIVTVRAGTPADYTKWFGQAGATELACRFIGG